MISLCVREGDGGENSEKVDDVDGNGSFSLWDCRLLAEKFSNQKSDNTSACSLGSK